MPCRSPRRGFGTWLVALLGLAGAAGAEPRAPVVVTPGAAASFQIAVQRFAGADGPRAERFDAALAEALEFSSVAKALPREGFLGPVTTPALEETPLCPLWTQVGADALLAGALAVDATRVAVRFRLFDPTRCRELLSRRYTQSLAADPTALARRIADDVVGAFLGLPGVASTELAFVSTRSGAREIYVMSADGTDPRPATANRSINTFPSWSPAGDALVYTSYRRENRPQLFLSSRGRLRPETFLRGLDPSLDQFRGVFRPSGDRLALVLSRDGASDIFTADLDGTRLRQLTNSRSIEVSPSWSPDGSRLALVSDRGGSPQIYVMDAGGGNLRRLTYQGSYNTNPAWSPDGRWIAYETRVEGQFDIWLIDPEGRVNVPLVTNPRSDESPSWAPNSRKLAFSSRRRGRADIYVIDASGVTLRRLTRDAGDNTNPAWGPFPR